ncbi:MAG: Peptidoglycan glycosyltransferase [Candidatus Magasanikbacteria bacterium GW2011_GWC2_37_14]|uniref:Peptidoglycan glycosyltransferase n=1 Tax=Candidatus Magasanikbacteria bacterium GW2011_GWC2_37_14 TaxID=1619046 RepID=A0A0G0GDQ5_9BACT|nr:MAG: Peptidoglycan glycosyltransferase [Candidatus Magasanikbacteria bacterium GW2011_GWC2_37_14]
MVDKKSYFFGEPLFSGKKLEGKFRNTWVEESFYFEKTFGKQKELAGTTKEYLGNNFTKNKYLISLLTIIAVFFLILFRLIYLQVFSGSDYRILAENNRQRIIPIPAERGLIYDRNNIPLTKNIPNFVLTLIPQTLPKDENKKNEIINKLAELTAIPNDEIKMIIEEYGNYTYESVVIKDNIEYEKALSILIALGDLPGIEIKQGSKRLYINKEEVISTSTPSSLAHVLGYIGKLNKKELDNLHSKGYLPSDVIGKVGIEKTFETYLRGIYGKKRIEVNATGKEQSILAEEAPIPGKHLILTIDKKIQNKLEEIISSYLKNFPSKRAAAVAINPQNGEVLALISLPAFDNNDFSGGIKSVVYNNYLNDKNQPLYNRVISGLYPSGSSIKPAIAAIALEEGIITSVTSFLSTGGLQVGDWFFPDWQAGGHGNTNVRKAIAWSVNTFFYYIGGGYRDFTGLGVEKIVEYLKKFGFSTQTGIDLPAENQGFLPSKKWKEETKKERWYVGDTYNVSIGQGDILVTPLQIANMTAFFANGGVLYKPQIIKSIIDPVTNLETEKIIPQIINRDFIKKENINTVKLGMKDCADYGSCRRLSLLPFSTAGKTGTAQWNKNKPNHAWFTSFAPYENPQIVVTVLVEEGGEGSSIAVPIVYDFYKWWANNGLK